MRELVAELVMSGKVKHWRRKQSIASARSLVTQLGETEREAVKRLFREKMMREAGTRDIEELVDWMGRHPIDKRRYPKTIDAVVGGRGRLPGRRHKPKL